MKSAKIKNIFIFFPLAVALVAVVLIQLRAMTGLRHRLSAKTQEYELIKSRTGRIFELEKELEAAREKKALIFEHIPREKKQVLNLMKEITVLGEKTGVSHLQFQLQSAETDGAAEGFTALQGKEEGYLPLEMISRDQDPEYVDTYYFNMTVECDFRRLFEFLQTIADLPQVVIVDRISVSRVRDLVPLQKAQVRFRVFTFASPRN